MASPPDRTNHGAERPLGEAGLTPRTLARELNRLFGPGTLAETAPYYWRDAGGIPRPPLPTLTAYVISRHLGRVVTVRTSGLGKTTPRCHPGLAGQRWHGRSVDTRAGTMRVAEDWLLGGLVDRRTVPIRLRCGARPGGKHLPHQPGRRCAGAPAASTDDPLVNQIEASVPQLQMLDDEHGGAAGLELCRCPGPRGPAGATRRRPHGRHHPPAARLARRSGSTGRLEGVRRGQARPVFRTTKIINLARSDLTLCA